MSTEGDIFKTYPLRFAGYGLGLGEALSGIVGVPAVRGLYAMAGGFIFAHTLYKPYLVSKRTQSPVKIVAWCADTFVYESIVSGFIPPFTAIIVRNTASSILRSTPGPAKIWVPALLSLASLPIVIPPCDYIVDGIMNQTIRQLYS